MKRAIVLSGGGSKGSYEVGVWKALRKLNIKYDIVTGTSVGALNAALMTQKTYFKAIRLWKNMCFDKVIDAEIDENKVVRSYAKNIIKGGMTVNNLKQTIDNALDLNRFYSSNINMGLITYNLKKLKPLILTKDKIPKDKLSDYLLASASCFPAFEKKEIAGTDYIDGGYFDNLPINLAIDMGADEIIAVDLKEVGKKQKVKNKDIRIITISPKNDIGSFLIFDSKMARRAMRLGFNDTFKTLNKLDGNKYTFRLNDLRKNYNRYNINLKYDEYLKIVEKLGYLFDIDDSYIYDIKKFNKLLITRFLKLKGDKAIKSTKIERLKKLFSKKYIVKYLYNQLDNKELSLIFKTEYKCALYMHTIMEEL
ncbi:MAG: patatin-like phospholipase family protein [Bacilli bacterium]|nr:patatin-like phospholipase family protein [Bacilli bacterium]